MKMNKKITAAVAAAMIQREFAQKERSEMAPIMNDIMKAIEQVRKDQGLDVVLESGNVVSGGMDITSAVAAKIVK